MQLEPQYLNALMQAHPDALRAAMEIHQSTPSFRYVGQSSDFYEEALDTLLKRLSKGFGSGGE